MVSTENGHPPEVAKATNASAPVERTELQAWQERCALVEAALEAANDVLRRELPSWQERCVTVEAALAAATARLAEEIPQWQERCELAESALASLDESRKGRSVAFNDTASFLRFASSFTPARAIGTSKMRVGAAADGGYVMIDDIVERSIALSLGIGNETSWDRHMSDLGATVHQYDHTVALPEGQPSNIVFHPKRIVDVMDGSDGSATIEQALSDLEGEEVGRPAILKIDIEGSEWPVLDAVPDAVLRRFDQIVCEYHDFGRATDPEWFDRACRVVAKLERHFQVVHVHGNNAEPIVVVGGVPFPSVIEVTHANRGRYRFQPTAERFPTEHDRPNHPGRPDLWLGSFSFDSGDSPMEDG